MSKDFAGRKLVTKFREFLADLLLWRLPKAYTTALVDELDAVGDLSQSR